MGNGHPAGRSSLLALSAGLAACSAAVWMLATGSTQPHELVVGIGAVVLSTLFLTPLFADELQQYRLCAQDLLSCWRLPWYVLSSSWEIVAVLARDLAGVERAPSLYRVCGFRTAKDEPRMVARRALAVAYTSVAPNFIVIDIDYTRSRMLFHQVRRSSVPQMTKQLGAEVSSDPRRHAASQGESDR